MKNIARVILLISTLIFQPRTGNTKPGGDGPRKHRSVRNVFWIHPNRARIINGLAIGPFNFQSFRQDSALTVNGMNLELPGVGFYPLPVQGSYIAVNGLDLSPLRYSGTSRGLALSLISSSVSGYGCQFGMLSGLDSEMHGLHIALVGAGSGKMRGAQIGCFNSAENAAGVMIGGWICHTDSMKGFSVSVFNEAKQHRGLQLGVINYAKELRGVQFGLINVAPNCRRKVMPIVLVAGRKATLE